MEIKNSPKLAEKFVCECCDYKCSKESDFKKHLTTLKHKFGNKMEKNGNENVAEDYKCLVCQKEYKTHSGLWKHAKNARLALPVTAEEEKKPLSENEVKHLTDMVIELVKSNTELQKQNQDFQEKMLELYKNSTNINGDVNTINSHNKTFNMQFFLNEQCKDAMNIADFIDSFQLQFADLERVGQLGYVDGISDIIIKKLNEMDIYKRPIHCSDTKRDIMYVRADNVWEKETNSHDRVRLLVRQVTHKNIKLLPLWTEEYPQAKDIHHSLNDTYIGMVGQAMGGRGDIEENENKIIKRIAKTVYIDKYN